MAKKASKSLTKKQRSSLMKQAAAGKDIGAKGKRFKQVAKKAAKKYGSAETGRKVAAAAMMRGRAKRLGK